MQKKSYDPDPSSKRSRVPPQLRAWVFGRHKRRTHDPKRSRGMAYGYGTVRGKPVHRGGAAWSGGKTLRRDPQKKGWRAKAKGALGKIESNLTWIGLVLGLVVPAEVCRASAPPPTDLYSWYVNGTMQETETLFGHDPRHQWTTLSYLQYKMTNTTWAVSFWASLGAQILTRLGALKPISVRLNTGVKKFSTGTLVASIFGMLFLLGGGEHRTTTSHPASSGSAPTRTVQFTMKTN